MNANFGDQWTKKAKPESLIVTSSLQITGYLLIYNVDVQRLSLPSLKIVWGEQRHDGAALQLDSNPRLSVLNLPALRGECF